MQTSVQTERAPAIQAIYQKSRKEQEAYAIKPEGDILGQTLRETSAYGILSEKPKQMELFDDFLSG